MTTRFKYDFWSWLIGVIIPIITVCIFMGRILERMDNIIVRLDKIETQYSSIITLEKRVAIVEEKIYNISKTLSANSYGNK